MGRFNQELIDAGIMLDANGLQEAVDWVKRCPNPHEGETEIEIRQIFVLGDFKPTSAPK